MMDRIQLKLMLWVAVILLVTSSVVGFNALGLGIYSDRFYVFTAISCFLVFIFVKMTLEHIKTIIDQRDSDGQVGEIN